MGTLSLTNMIDEIKAFHGNRSDLDSRLPRIINLSQMRIARAHDWDELRNITNPTTSASTKNLSISTEFSNLRQLYTLKLIDGSNSHRLIGIPYPRFDMLYPYPESYTEGRPRVFTRWGDTLTMVRIPDQAYTLEARWTAWPATLPNSDPNNEYSDLEQKDDMIIMLSTSWSFMALGNQEKAAKFWRVYVNMLNEAIEEQVESPEINFAAMHKEYNLKGEYWRNPFIVGVD